MPALISRRSLGVEIPTGIRSIIGCGSVKPLDPTALGRLSVVGIHFEWAKLLGLSKLPNTHWGSFRDSTSLDLQIVSANQG
jgi:hypothetical protein